MALFETGTMFHAPTVEAEARHNDLMPGAPTIYRCIFYAHHDNSSDTGPCASLHESAHLRFGWRTMLAVSFLRNSERRRRRRRAALVKTFAAGEGRKLPRCMPGGWERGGKFTVMWLARLFMITRTLSRRSLFMRLSAKAFAIGAYYRSPLAFRITVQQLTAR